jgi:hypothetical protein
MAKATLLDLVQDILADADGDSVNSISDTIESDQCARVVRDAFRHIVDTYDFDYVKTLVKLDATSASTPTVMTRPEGVHSVEWVKYDVRTTAGANTNFQDVAYQDPKTFMDAAVALSADASNVTQQTLTDSGHVLNVFNDRAPQHFTFLEDYDRLVFDAYDAALETNLQQSKSLAFVVEKPDLTLADATEIDLPKHLATLVRNEARAMYFDLFKDGVTDMVDRRRRESNVRAQRKRHMTVNTHNDNAPNYGRK